MSNMSESKEKMIHRCEGNFYDDVSIRYQRINKEQWSWVFDYTWVATQNEVDEGLAETVGSPIMKDTLLISYCPFCGCKLIGIRENTW
jgi:hypothetical protein